MPAAKTAVKAKASRSLTKATHSPGTATDQREALEQRLNAALSRVMGAFLVQAEVLALAELKRRGALTAAIGLPEGLLTSGFTAAVLENVWEFYTEKLVEDHVDNLTNVMPANLAAKASSKWVIERALAFFQRDVGDLAYDTVLNIFQRADAEGLPERMTKRLLDDELSFWTPEGEPSKFGWRVERLARTAATGIYNTSMLEQLRADGYDLKLWVSHHDDKVRDSHLHADGIAIPLDTPFTVGDSQLMYPGDTSGDIGEWINCRCVIVGEMGEPNLGIDWSLPVMTTSERIAAGLPASPFLQAVEAVEEVLVSSGATATFASNPQQARAPKGSPIGGRWIDTPSGILRSLSRLRYGTDVVPKGTEEVAADLADAERNRLANDILAREGRPSVEAIAERVSAIYDLTTPEQRAAGAIWYEEATRVAEAMSAQSGGKVTMEQAAAILAHTSTQTYWEANVNIAESVAQGLTYEQAQTRLKDSIAAGVVPKPKMGGAYVLGENYKKAQTALSHPDPIGRDSDNLGTFTDPSNKTHTFASNIMGQTDGVTVDSHMYKVLGQDSAIKGKIKGVPQTVRKDQVYEALAQAVRVSAKDKGISPAEMQAVTWVWELTANKAEYDRLPASLTASGAIVGSTEEPIDPTPVPDYFYAMARQLLGVESPEALTASSTYAGPSQARAPQGTPIGGQWIVTPGGLLVRVGGSKTTDAVDSLSQPPAWEGAPSRPPQTPNTATALWESVGASEFDKSAQPRLHPERYIDRTVENPKAQPGPLLRYGEVETRYRDVDGVPTIYDVTPLVPGETWDTYPQDQLEKNSIGAGQGPIGVLRIVPGSERPLPSVYRIMDEREYQQAIQRGYIQTDGRMNIDQAEGTVASVGSTGTFYAPWGSTSGPQNAQARIVRIGVQPEDGWHTDPNDSYIKTDLPIPVDRIEAVTPPFTEAQANAPYVGLDSLTASGNPTQARVPKGSESGGQWIDTPGGLLRQVDAIDARGNTRQYGLNRQSVEDYFAKSPYAPAFADLDDYDRDLLADYTRESLREAVDSGVKVQVSMNALAQIADDGRFRTLEELESSGESLKGSAYGLARSIYEADIMGVPALNIRPSHERPIYGYGTEDEFNLPTQSYGDVTVYLKDSVKERTTWTVGDSLDYQVRPLWTDEVGTADSDTLIASSHWAIAPDTPLRLSDYWADGPHEGVDYVEAQVHGGVSWGDIDFIEVDDITQVPADLADYARDSGVSLTERDTGYTYDDYRGDESYHD